MRDLHKAYMGFLGAAVVDLSPAAFRTRNNHLTEEQLLLLRSREEIRAYIISTGKWGCGAFGGNAILKFLLQVVAAYLCCGPSPTSSLANDSLNGRGREHSGNDDPYVCLRFSAYRDPELQATLEQVYQACHGLTPRQILDEVLTKDSLANTLFTSGDGMMTFRADLLINLLQNLQR
jgi:hypothetical protein